MFDLFVPFLERGRIVDHLDDKDDLEALHQTHGHPTYQILLDRHLIHEIFEQLAGIFAIFRSVKLCGSECVQDMRKRFQVSTFATLMDL